MIKYFHSIISIFIVVITISFQSFAQSNDDESNIRATAMQQAVAWNHHDELHTLPFLLKIAML